MGIYAEYWCVRWPTHLFGIFGESAIYYSTLSQTSLVLGYSWLRLFKQFTGNCNDPSQYFDSTCDKHLLCEMVIFLSVWPKRFGIVIIEFQPSVEFQCNSGFKLQLDISLIMGFDKSNFRYESDAKWAEPESIKCTGNQLLISLTTGISSIVPDHIRCMKKVSFQFAFA